MGQARVHGTKTNIIYCTHNEKVQRIRTDASPFTHGDVAATEHIIFVFPGAGFEKSAARHGVKGV